MGRHPFVAGNWKLNLGPRASAELAERLRVSLAGTIGITVAVFPTALSVAAVVPVLKGSALSVGVQEIEAAASGALTGGNAAEMAREAGCEFALVGHSERRQRWGETSTACADKLVAAFRAGLLPIYCIGETLAERRAGRVEEVVFAQLEQGLGKLAPDQIPAVTLAYEPVWAIGTGEVATPDQAQAVHAAIRGWLRQRHGALADDVRIQYGGSVKADNARELLSCPDIDGALVGGAALDAAGFTRIVEAAVT
jgi:triosephosphate isomerase (TIM)